MSIRWSARRRFWNRLVLMKYRANEPARIPVPVDDDPIAAVSLAQRLPAIPISNIRVAAGIPKDEAAPDKVAFYWFQTSMYRWFPAMQEGLPPVDDDTERALAEAYTPAHRRLFPAPVLPPELEEPDIGALAVASPFACYLEQAGDGRFRWNLDVFEGCELRPGLVPLGSTVTFAVDGASRALRAVEIDCELGRCRPGDRDWERAQRLALCAATTYLTLARHYNGVHLAAGGPLAIATRNQLPASHPVRRVLWPHVYGTHYSNYISTKGQLLPGGDFDSTFSFTHAGVCNLFRDSYERYDLTVIHPRRDAERRGIVDAGFETPALDNQVAHFDVMRAHAARYLAVYYRSDDDLTRDGHVEAWVEELDRLIPGGVKGVLGGAVTLDGVADLIAGSIYLAAVLHETLGTGMWNYQLWTHVQPVQVRRSGEREPVDVFQRLVNANFLLNVRRSPLMQDFGYLALDPDGAGAFAAFQHDLATLQERLDHEPAACWRIEPKILEANINA
jgi:hypothetical protein